MNIAQTIMRQIKDLDFFAFGAWGAKDFVNMGDGLRFKTSGTKWKGYVYVKYDAGQDLYNVEFSRIRKLELKLDKLVNGVFVDELPSVIDGFVGS